LRRLKRDAPYGYGDTGRASCALTLASTRRSQGTARNSRRPSFDPRSDIGTDYALIAIGVGAALVALIYLLLI